MWNELCELLLDLDYLQARLGVLTAEQRTTAATVYNALRDYLAALQGLPAAHPLRQLVEQLYRVLDRNAHVLRKHPRLLLQQIANTSDWEGTVLEDRMSAAVGGFPWPLLRLLNRPGGGTDSALLRVLVGHTQPVISVAFSPDGRILASGSWDKTVRLWDTTTGARRHRLRGHTGRVTSVAFGPDGRTLASGSHDGTVRLWDAASGAPLQILHGHLMVSAVAFSPDRCTLASSGLDGTVQLWEVLSGAPLQTLQGHSSSVESVVFSPDGRTLASGSEDKTVRLWDVATGTLRHTLQGHTEAVLSVAFSPDGRTLASGSRDRTARLWDAGGGHTLHGHADWVLSVAFSPDGRTLASGSRDRTVRLWDATTGDLIVWRPFQAAILSLWFHPEVPQLSVADDGGGTGRPRVYLLEIIRP